MIYDRKVMTVSIYAWCPCGNVLIAADLAATLVVGSKILLTEPRYDPRQDSDISECYMLDPVEEGRVNIRAVAIQRAVIQAAWKYFFINTIREFEGFSGPESWRSTRRQGCRKRDYFQSIQSWLG